MVEDVAGLRLLEPEDVIEARAKAAYCLENLLAVVGERTAKRSHRRRLEAARPRPRSLP